MRKTFLLVIICSFLSSVQGQVTLEDCQEKARRNYPLIKQYGFLERTKKYSLAQVFKNYIPQLSINGNLTWQSDVTEFPDEFSNMLDYFDAGITFPGKEQYNISLELTQNILDGGVSLIQKKRIEAENDLNRQELEVNLYALTEQINQLFFSVLLLDEQIRQNKLLSDELERNYTLVSSYIENGVGQQSDLDEIKVEILSSQQRDMEMKTSRKTFIRMLSAFIGREIGDDETFVKPSADYNTNAPLNRPELVYYNLQIDLIEQQWKMLGAKGMPHLSLFAKGAYGNPGLNMFESGFKPYFVGGVRFTWNFGMLYSFADEINTFRTQRQQAEMQKEIFQFNTQQKLMQKNSEIEKLQNLLENDAEIIRLREDIQKTADVKVANGAMSINDLLRCINSTSAARQNKSYHEIQLLLAIWQLKTEKGIIMVE